MPNEAAIYGRNRAKGMISTSGGVDKIPQDRCRACRDEGADVLVYFTTDGFGELRVWNRDCRTLHRHQAEA